MSDRFQPGGGSLKKRLEALERLSFKEEHISYKEMMENKTPRARAENAKREARWAAVEAEKARYQRMSKPEKIAYKKAELAEEKARTVEQSGNNTSFANSDYVCSARQRDIQIDIEELQGASAEYIADARMENSILFRHSGKTLSKEDMDAEKESLRTYAALNLPASYHERFNRLAVVKVKPQELVADTQPYLRIVDNEWSEH
jgi:hypothetical protein